MLGKVLDQLATSPAPDMCPSLGQPGTYGY